MPVSLRPLRATCLLFVLLLALAVSGCATSGGVAVDAGYVNADRAEQFARAGDLDAAANAFIAQADQGGERSAYFRLRAAEVLREAGDFDAVARAITDIRRRRLHGDELLRLDLLDAELALRNNDAARANSLLSAPERDLAEPLLVRMLELRARAATVSGDRFGAARIRATLDERLLGADRDSNRGQIIETLAALDNATLKARAIDLRTDDPLVPWIEQALRRKGQILPRELPHPQRPVGTLLPGADNEVTREGFSAVRQVALILPLSGQVASVSQSIRDGFLAAYFNDDGERPQVRVYDAGRDPAEMLAAYARAVDDGAGFVVGPLQREAVGALFRQPLKVRVLALNHPDSGEVPPQGSAEFGLLPDAEGAQAAERMLGAGITRAAVIAAESDWAERASLAFRAQFESHGGSITGEARIREADFNYKTAVLVAAGKLADSTSTEGSTRTAPRDGGVFISMRPQQARLLLPQLKIAGVNVPVFATSHVNSGEVSPGLDRDLDGVEFCDATWLFAPVPGRPDRNEIGHYLGSASGLGARLFAFGMDAYALLPYMDWLLANPESYLDGATGQLAADSFGRIHRVLTWARFAGGVARPLQGALSPMTP